MNKNQIINEDDFTYTGLKNKLKHPDDIKKMQVRDVLDLLYELNTIVSKNVNMHFRESEEEWIKDMRSINSDIRDILINYDHHIKRGI